jgi:hypothetical protein
MDTAEQGLDQGGLAAAGSTHQRNFLSRPMRMLTPSRTGVALAVGEAGVFHLDAHRMLAGERVLPVSGNAAHPSIRQQAVYADRAALAAYQAYWMLMISCTGPIMNQR